MSEKWLLAVSLPTVLLLLCIFRFIRRRCQQQSQAAKPRCGMKWEDELIGEPKPSTLRQSNSRSLF